MKNHRLSIALAIAFSISATVVAYGQGNQGGPANTPGTPSTPQNAPPNTPANRPGNQQPGNQPNTQPPATAPSTTSANTGSSAAAINEAIEMNMGEVALGRQAATKAQNSKVKNFANMIVKDHNEAIAKLRAISTTGSPTSSNTNTKPNADHQKVEERLSKLSGAQYDQEFMNEMVTGHTKAVEFFEKHSGETSSASTSANSTRNTTTTNSTTNSTNTNSTTTNSTNTNTTRSTNTASTNTLASVSKDLLPTVRMHLKEAQDIQRELQGNTAKPATGTPNTTDSNRTTTPAPNR